MTIGELSEQTGLPASTIRYWEQIGVLPKPPRLSGQRRYSPSAVDALAALQLAQACGFTLREMRYFVQGFQPAVAVSRRWREMADGKRTALDAQITRLKAMRKLLDRVSQCQCAGLEQCGQWVRRWTKS